jgi:hypothetical protein
LLYERYRRRKRLHFTANGQLTPCRQQTSHQAMPARRFVGLNGIGEGRELGLLIRAFWATLKRLLARQAKRVGGP